MTSAVAIGVAVGSQLRVAPPPEPASVRFIVPPPEDLSFRGMMALSPDGQRLALVTIDDKRRTQLWVRSMSSEVAATRRRRPMAPHIHSGHRMVNRSDSSQTVNSSVWRRRAVRPS